MVDLTLVVGVTLSPLLAPLYVSHFLSGGSLCPVAGHLPRACDPSFCHFFVLDLVVAEVLGVVPAWVEHLAVVFFTLWIFLGWLEWVHHLASAFQK